MKTGVLAVGFSVPNIQAPDKQVYWIAKKLQQQNNEVLIINLVKKPDPNSQSTLIDNIEIREVKFDLLSRYIVTGDFLSDLIKKEGIEVIHVYSTPAMMVNLSFITRKVAVQVIVHFDRGAQSLQDLRFLKFQDLLHYRNSGLLSIFSVSNFIIPRFLIKRALSNSKIKKVFVYSVKTQKQLMLPKHADKICRIPPVIDLKLISETKLQKFESDLNINPTDKILLYYGGTSSDRGLDTLISAFSIVEKKAPNATLVLLLRFEHECEKKESLWVKTLISKSKSNKIVYRIGSLSNVLNFVNLADITVFPFRWTYGLPDFPLTILESMALGKVIITSKIGALPEVIQDGWNGLLIDPRNINELANTVLKVLNDDKLANTLSINALSTSQKFDQVD